jgi:hypothetical protein
MLLAFPGGMAVRLARVSGTQPPVIQRRDDHLDSTPAFERSCVDHAV